MRESSVDLQQKALEIRKEALNMIYEGKTGHTGGSLSETDILVTLFYSVMNFDASHPEWPERDRFVLSKGHSVEAYYVILADLGYLPKEELKTFSKFGTRLIGHPNNKVPGIEVNSGALGHGLSMAAGMALAAKLDKKDYRVFVLMGDGELAEGSVWEAAMAASYYKLDNLYAIVDRNGLQISGATEDVMGLEPLADKWRSFGFAVDSVDGHDYGAIKHALMKKTAEKPTLLIARTTKGKGVSFMENQAKWHHGVPSEEQLAQALAELEEAARI